MRVLKLSWRETERGWGDRADGFSFHKTIGDAEKFLAKEYDNLPTSVPDEFSYPGSSWGEPAHASWVSVADDGVLARSVMSSGSFFIGTSNGSDAAIERLYQEAKSAPQQGSEIIDYMYLTHPKRTEDCVSFRPPEYVFG